MSAFVAPTLSRALAVQLRTIGALVMRELHTRFGRDNIGYLWLFLEPGLLAMGVAAIHALEVLRLPWGMQVVPFYVSGYTAYCLFRSVVNRAGTTLEGNGSLLYHRQVTIFDLLFARALLDAAAMMTAGLIIMGVTAALDIGQFPHHPLLFFAAWGLNLWFCFSLSLLVLAGNVAFPSLDRFVHPMTYFALGVSGVFYIFEQAPPFVRAIVIWVPLAQILEMLREGVFANFTSPYLKPFYIVGWCLGLTLFGLLAIRAVREKVELE